MKHIELLTTFVEIAQDHEVAGWPSTLDTRGMKLQAWGNFWAQQGVITAEQGKSLRKLGQTLQFMKNTRDRDRRAQEYASWLKDFNAFAATILPQPEPVVDVPVTESDPNAPTVPQTKKIYPRVQLSESVLQRNRDFDAATRRMWEGRVNEYARRIVERAKRGEDYENVAAGIIDVYGDPVANASNLAGLQAAVKRLWDGPASECPDLAPRTARF